MKGELVCEEWPVTGNLLQQPCTTFGIEHQSFLLKHAYVQRKASSTALADSFIKCVKCFSIFHSWTSLIAAWMVGQGYGHRVRDFGGIVQDQWHHHCSHPTFPLHIPWVHFLRYCLVLECLWHVCMYACTRPSSKLRSVRAVFGKTDEWLGASCESTCVLIEATSRTFHLS